MAKLTYQQRWQLGCAIMLLFALPWTGCACFFGAMWGSVVAGVIDLLW